MQREADFSAGARGHLRIKQGIRVTGVLLDSVADREDSWLQILAGAPSLRFAVKPRNNRRMRPSEAAGVEAKRGWSF